MICTIGNIKGGVGKTTVAINLSLTLASLGQDVLFIDADRQRSGTDYFSKRAEMLDPRDLDLAVIPLDGKEIFRQVPKLSRKFDHIIIDTAGSDTGSLRAGIVVSNMIVVPVIPQALDIWALEETNSVLEEGRAVNPSLAVKIFINMVAPRGDIYDQIARENIPAIMEDCELLTARIVRRQAFANSLAGGEYILESRDDKAKDEFQAFFEELLGTEIMETA